MNGIFLNTSCNKHWTSEECTRNYDGATVENDLTSSNSIPNTNNAADECDGKSTSKESTYLPPLKTTFAKIEDTEKEKFVILLWKI